MIKYEARARSSMVEQFPFKEAVLGSSPSGLTKAPSSSGLGHQVFSLNTWVRVPMGSLRKIMTTERIDLSVGSLYQRMIEAAVDLAKNPNRSSKFMAVANDKTKEAMNAIRQGVEAKRSGKSH